MYKAGCRTEEPVQYPACIKTTSEEAVDIPAKNIIRRPDERDIDVLVIPETGKGLLFKSDNYKITV